MNAKKWLSIFISPILLIFSLNILVSPEQSNKNFLKLKKFYSGKYHTLRLKNKLEKNKHVLVLGTSRLLKTDSKIVKSKYEVIKPHYVYGNPHCNNEFIKSLNSRHLENIDSIYYGLSYNSFYKKRYCNNLKFSLSEYIYQFISFNITKKTIDTLYKNLSGKYNYYINENGVEIEVVSNKFIPYSFTKKEFLLEVDKRKAESSVSTDTFETLRKLDQYLNKKGLEIIYHTDPLTDFRFGQLNWDNIYKFHLYLTNSVNSYYSFNSISLSKKYSLFSDESHLSYEGLLYLYQKEFTFDNKVTKSNIHNHLDLLFIKFNNAKLFLSKNYIKEY